MSITYIGSSGDKAVMHDQFQPMPEQNEFGVEVLTREVRGTVATCQSFVKSLTHGLPYAFAGVNFFLQGWQAIADPVFPGVRLTYKGFKSGAPKDKSRTESVAMSANKGATVTSGGEELTCTKDAQYIGHQTTYDYFVTSKPDGARYSAVDSSLNVVYLNSRINVTDSTGKTTTYVGNAPSDVATALSLTETDTTTGFTFERIYGTPYFQCQDVVTRMLT